MRVRLLLPAILVATALPACDNQEAADHRQSVAAIEKEAASLRDAPSSGEPAITELKMIASRLRGLRGVSRQMKASQYRLLTQLDLQLAAHLRQRGLEDRTHAIETAATIEALTGAAALQKRRLGQRASTPGQLGSDELANARIATIQQRDGLQRQQQKQQPGLTTLDQANTEAAADVLKLRTRAAEMLARAAAVDAITGRPLRTEAAELEHRAAGIEADMERRATQADLYARLDLENLSIRTEGVSDRVDALDEEIQRVHTLATDRQDHDRAGKAALEDLGNRLGEASSTLIDLLTGPLRAHYDTTLAALQQAVQSASKVQGDRESKEGDQLARIQAEMALMNLASARADMLNRSMRLLGEVAVLGQSPGSGKWSETRQVLQQDWAQADAIATASRAEAVSLIGNLDGEAATMLVGQLDNSGSPPEVFQPPSPPDGLPPGGGAAGGH